jgi:hypothetical protein
MQKRGTRANAKETKTKNNKKQNPFKIKNKKKFR